MAEEHRVAYEAALQKINGLSPVEFNALMLADQCPYPVQHLVGVPLGMFHCRLCGTMVVAGMPHLPMDPPWDPDKSLPAQWFYEQHPELLGERDDLG